MKPLAEAVAEVATTTLTTSEQSELQDCEARIERGLQAFIDVATALRLIRDKRLYRAHYSTFEHYCRARWAFTDERARLLMRGAEVVENLQQTPTTVGVLPANERQVRPLTQLEPEAQVEAWRMVLETAPEGKVTAAHVEQVVKLKRELDTALENAPEPVRAVVQTHGVVNPDTVRLLTDLQRNGRESFNELRDSGYLQPGEAHEAVPITAGALALKKALEQKAQIHRQLAGGAKPHVAHNTGEMEWYTPPAYLEAAREVMGGIDLDPASCDAANQIVQATAYYDMATDGLAHDWHGRVWLNPPYASEWISKFCRKLVEEHLHGNTQQAIALVNNATETKWFQLLLRHAAAVCFPSARIKFLDAQGNAVGEPLQGQALLYFGTDGARFEAGFKPFGAVLHVVTR